MTGSKRFHNRISWADWRRATRVVLIAGAIAVMATSVRAVRADDAFGPSPTWKPVAADDARAKLDQYLVTINASDAQKAEVDKLWAAGAGDLLDRFVRALALVDSNAQQVVEFCQLPLKGVQQPEFDWLLDAKTPAVVRNNARLYYGRYLVQHQLHDEALLILTGLEPDEVIDPAGLLFYQAVVHHRLVNTKESRAAALKLLEREQDLPRRYQQLAALMTDDLKEIEYDSLDHISRRMNDIRRRLGLGRAGEKVVKVEDGVIDSLDKLIKEMEQQQQQQQASSAGGPSSPDSKPAQNSQVAPLKGPGKVDQRDVGHKVDWGSLPPKEREAVLQQIGKEFPSHFRDAIEQYFRKIAGEEEAGEP